MMVMQLIYGHAVSYYTLCCVDVCSLYKQHIYELGIPWDEPTDKCWEFERVRNRKFDYDPFTTFSPEVLGT